MPAKPRPIEDQVPAIHLFQFVPDQPLEVKYGVVGQVRRDDVLQRGEYGFSASGIAGPIRPSSPGSSGVAGSSASHTGCTWDDRELHAAREFRDVVLAAISHRTNDHMGAVIGDQFWWHGLEFAAEQEIEEQRVHDIVAMVAERDLVAPVPFAVR